MRKDKKNLIKNHTTHQADFIRINSLRTVPTNTARTYMGNFRGFLSSPSGNDSKSAFRKSSKPITTLLVVLMSKYNHVSFLF
jgi:hypothetical protein